MRGFFMDEEFSGCPADLGHISYDENTTAKQLVDNMNDSVAPVEETNEASQAYAVGKRLVYRGRLYKATSAIAEGDTLEPGTNIATDTIDDEISAINTHLSQLDMSLKDISYTGVTGWKPQTVTAKHRGSIGAIRTQSSITIISADANAWHHCLTLNEYKPFYNIYLEPFDGSTAEPSAVFTARIDTDGKMYIRCTTPGTYTMVFEGTWLVGE